MIEVVGSGNEYCLNRFSIFFTKTLDFIADPNFNDRLIPSELFDIGNMLTSKFKNSN